MSSQVCDDARASSGVLAPLAGNWEEAHKEAKRRVEETGRRQKRFFARHEIPVEDDEN